MEISNINIIKQLISDIKEANNLKHVQQIHLDLFGKHGIIKANFSNLKHVVQAERQGVVLELNQLKHTAEKLIKEKTNELELLEIDNKIKKHYVDTSLPGRKNNFGKMHPISDIVYKIQKFLTTHCIQCIDSIQDIEDDWHNFTALNFSTHHPARQMHDTFYLKSDQPLDKHFLLRTHTSNTQIRYIVKNALPLKFASFGRVYRNDSDVTHLPTFHQLEVVYIDKKVNLANMKFFLVELLKFLFGEKVKIRIRPSYFPFTSPSCELDAKLLDNAEWMEILGCGMIHDNVLVNANLDAKQWQGFAFGIGIERIAMIKHNIKDIRDFFENNKSWINHYGLPVTSIL